MNNEHHNTHHITKNQARFFGSLLMILFFTVVLVWFAFAAGTGRQLEIRPTHLILRSDGCDFLKANGIETKAAEFGNGCSVLIPFRQNTCGSGGLITVGEKQVKISDSQIVIVGSTENLPWTPAQTNAEIEMLISTIIMLGMVAWILKMFFKSNACQEDDNQ